MARPSPPLRTLRRVGLILALLALGAAPAQAPTKAPSVPIEVMVVGVFHLSNPGHDLHNLQVDDVLAARRQAELVRISQALARFRPTKVGVEWPEDLVAERYPKFLAGALAPSRNEVVQLGFRLAKMAHAQGVYGLDADGDFPYDRVKAFAETHHLSADLDRLNLGFQDQVDQEARLLSRGTISSVLRYLNDPARLATDNQFYRAMLRYGEGAEQPGADLDAAWYRRNLLICANLVQIAKGGDRIVVFFGAGHAFLLRQCVSESPGFRLVEANAYLPR